MLRSKSLLALDKPIVMETHGGFGKLFDACYAHVPVGIVMEKGPAKAEALSHQRPTWAVYECEAVSALRAGLGSHLVVNFLDLDPHGEPWPTLDAFFGSVRPFADRMVLVVNDGLRGKVKATGGWDVRSLRDIVSRVGLATTVGRSRP